MPVLTRAIRRNIPEDGTLHKEYSTEYVTHLHIMSVITYNHLLLNMEKKLDKFKNNRLIN
jgi:hypothetical protein